MGLLDVDMTLSGYTQPVESSDLPVRRTMPNIEVIHKRLLTCLFVLTWTCEAVKNEYSCKDVNLESPQCLQNPRWTQQT